MSPNHIKSISIATLITLSTITAQAITTTEKGGVQIEITNPISTDTNKEALQTLETNETIKKDVEGITKLYIATFGRTPSQEEVDYWLDESGLTIEQIAKSFFDQPETQELYPEGSSNEEFVMDMYLNLFDRAPDAAGLEYWVKELNGGNVSRDYFILALINGAQGEDKSILDEKTEDALEELDDSLKIEAILKNGDFTSTEEMWIRHKLEYYGYDEALKFIDDIEEIDDLIKKNKLEYSEAREVRQMLYNDGIAAAKILIREYNPPVDPGGGDNGGGNEDPGGGGPI